MAKTSTRQTSTACRHASHPLALHSIHHSLHSRGHKPEICIRYNQRRSLDAHAQGGAGPVVGCNRLSCKEEGVAKNLVICRTQGRVSCSTPFHQCCSCS